MKIAFLGTGAAERYPSPWCKCSNCTYARVHKGKNLRAFSSVLIDDEMMIDMTESAMLTANHLGLCLDQLAYLLVTHVHPDHFSPACLWSRYFPKDAQEFLNDNFTNYLCSPRVTPLVTLQVLGNRYVEDALLNSKHLPNPIDDYAVSFRRIKSLEHLNLDGFKVIPIASQHVSDSFTLNYCIIRNGKKLLYASDTGGYPPEVWQEIGRHTFDGVIAEATGGHLHDSGTGHMNLQKVREFRAELKRLNSIREDSRFILTHMSPHWTPPHDIFEAELAKEGIEVAYDGKVINL